MSPFSLDLRLLYTLKLPDSPEPSQTLTQLQSWADRGEQEERRKAKEKEEVERRKAKEKEEVERKAEEEEAEARELRRRRNWKKKMRRKLRKQLASQTPAGLVRLI